MRLFVDSLTNVDFSYLCTKRGLLGETWLANVVLEGELDEQGMVCDFGVVKKQLRDWLDTELDHRLLVPVDYTECSHQATNETTSVVFITQEQRKLTTAGPAQAITLINKTEITPESVAAWCEELLQNSFGKGVKKVTLSFTPENIQGAVYHYSHGLKKHLGNCQRIAHGHRSTLNIWKNGEYDQVSVDLWSAKFQDIYLGTREDISGETADSISFAYTAQQGGFTLTLPKEQCYLMDTDTTVEFIALHIAQELKKAEPDANFKVQAFEGIGKGAIAEV